MRILLTGAAGYTGRGVAQVLGQRHQVRGLDVKAGEGPADMVVGDVADLDTCRKATQGMEAVVFCHMAPRNPDAYAQPPMAIDINVKGTANVYHAMVEQKISRAVLISTTGLLLAPPGPEAEPGKGPYQYKHEHSGLYAITKLMQETLAAYYHASFGIATTMLRPGWIVYDGECVTKYGQKMEQYFASLVDPRDIGAAIQNALDMAQPGLEAFRLAQDDEAADLTATHERLGWRAQHRFTSLKRV